MSPRIVVPPEVEAQIGVIDRWWREQRPAALGLFLEELAAAFELLQGAPALGAKYARAPVRDVRRLLLRATRYHVVESDVIVLAVWSAVRGSGPDLRPPS